MEIQPIKNSKIAEVTSKAVVIETTQDGLDLLGNIYYQGFDSVIVQEKHITPEFFDLKNGMAGEILQKFSTYRIRLAIVGEYAKFTKKSIQDFIYESNKNRHINFVASLDEAVNVLSNN